jgi:predicted O-methyltransferase YrrM
MIHAEVTMPLQKPVELVYQRAHERAAKFIEDNASKALIFNRKPKLHEYVSRAIVGTGLAIECGVFKGASINRMAKLLPDRTIYGFDSFEGLSEDWVGHDHVSGHFDLGGNLPQVEPNVRLVKGWIDDTFEPFLNKNKGVIDYLHVDTDTYSPARTILSLAKSRLAPGSIILFDELYGYPAWEENEYKALNETIPADCYEFIGFSNMEAALRITKKPT